MSHTTTTIFLSLILLTGTLFGTTLYAYAQDDKEDEEDQQNDKDNNNNNNDSKDEDSDSKDNDEEEPITNETIQATVQEIVEAELKNKTTVIPTTISNENQQPIVNNLSGDHILNPQPTQFDATCNCTTTTTDTPVKPQPTPPPPPPPPVQNTIQQIPISTDTILDFESLGKVVDPAYTNYYTVSNLFDNKIDDLSYWSQAGNSGFWVKLDPTIIDDYQVCSMELNNIPNPKNTPFVLDVFVDKNYTGVIDSTSELIQFDSCIKNMDQILLIFNPENEVSEDFISIGEIKLFGNKLGATEGEPIPPPTQPPTTTPPPTTPPGQQPGGPYKNATKINISDSDAQIDIKNSTVTFKFDPEAAQATGYNVITIPNSKVVN